MGNKIRNENRGMEFGVFYVSTVPVCGMCAGV